jgi:hypothetical protein
MDGRARGESVTPATSQEVSRAQQVGRTCGRLITPSDTFRSETSLCHFIQAFFERLVMSQHRNATRIFTRWGSLSSHGVLSTRGFEHVIRGRFSCWACSSAGRAPALQESRRNHTSAVSGVDYAETGGATNPLNGTEVGPKSWDDHMG